MLPLALGRLCCWDLSEEQTEWEYASSEGDRPKGAMQKLWHWVRERKRDTIRKWRSSGAPMNGENGASDGALNRAGRESKNSRKKKTSEPGTSTFLHVPHAPSTTSLPPTMEEAERKVSDYEDFFKESEPVISLHRRHSNRTFINPVLPPDVEDTNGTTQWLESRESRKTPNASPLPPRSPRMIRFNIPEVQISLEDDDRQVLTTVGPTVVRQRSSSPQPPVEIEWSSSSPRPNSANANSDALGTPSNGAMKTSMQTVSLESDEILCPVQRTGSERPRRQSQAMMARRQSTIQTAQAMSGRRSSTTIIPLTFPQIHLIRTLWRQIYMTKGPTVIGTTLFHRLCFKSPEIKDQIRAAPLPAQFNNHDEFVKAHCKAVAELVDQVVENLDNLDNMNEELMRIGRVHAKMTRGGVTGKLWNLVAETFIDCTLEWGDKRCRSETVRKAWALIIAFMVEKIKLGHHEQRKLMLSARASVGQLEGINRFQDLSLHSNSQY
ncbi:glb-8 [Pristionchus pacificus]|uniref:Glb-8 n=1 Tax=Pristionchus pacificus TaxID=54126 RepID=A0A2A6BUW5_PRIPA|nr:glb-8 [Pristionchus pacificus]|eukprot:PDM69782.1 glb-8 [Pristionchus pacificus]